MRKIFATIQQCFDEHSHVLLAGVCMKVYTGSLLSMMAYPQRGYSITFTVKPLEPGCDIPIDFQTFQELPEDCGLQVWIWNPEECEIGEDAFHIWGAYVRVVASCDFSFPRDPHPDDVVSEMLADLTIAQVTADHLVIEMAVAPWPEEEADEPDKNLRATDPRSWLKSLREFGPLNLRTGERHTYTDTTFGASMLLACRSQKT